MVAALSRSLCTKDDTHLFFPIVKAFEKRSKVRGKYSSCTSRGSVVHLTPNWLMVNLENAVRFLQLFTSIAIILLTSITGLCGINTELLCVEDLFFFRFVFPVFVHLFVSVFVDMRYAVCITNRKIFRNVVQITKTKKETDSQVAQRQQDKLFSCNFSLSAQLCFVLAIML